MNLPVTAIELSFADGTYRFWLPLVQVNELERKLASMAKSGVMVPQSMLALEWQLRAGIALQPDGSASYAGAADLGAGAIREVIRQGLAGGNHGVVDGEPMEVGPQRAIELVDAYCYPSRPLGESAALAWRILGAAIYGPQVGA